MGTLSTAGMLINQQLKRPFFQICYLSYGLIYFFAGHPQDRAYRLWRIAR